MEDKKLSLSELLTARRACSQSLRDIKQAITRAKRAKNPKHSPAALAMEGADYSMLVDKLNKLIAEHQGLPTKKDGAE